MLMFAAHMLIPVIKAYPNYYANLNSNILIVFYGISFK